MSCEEQQEEEAEVLKSIYEGDTCFKEINSTTYQYKYDDEENTYKSFLLEIQWNEKYPETMPILNMDLFYNKHIVERARERIISELAKQAEDFLGTAMTYTLFEWVKENLSDLLAEQPDIPQVAQNTETSMKKESHGGRKKDKKEQLTKAQKRRLYDKFGNADDRPRGWDWVDVVKHLCQTGGQASSVTEAN